ncbi:MAG: exo-alpha-sialidase [Chloroflexi bacterium]|nr:exo-alpha-sialidase [Chloroflexota bacterium]
MAIVDFDTHQQVEGYAQLVSASGKAVLSWNTTNPLAPDFRGSSEAAWTREWWLAPNGTVPDVAWLTAPLPEARDTTFTFIGESANLPEGLYPPNQAKLYVDGAYALTFDLGQRLLSTWEQGEFALTFEPRQVHTTADNYHRQFEASGCGGLYRLAVPASRLRAGQPVEVRVALEPLRTDTVNWFAIRQIPNVLEISPQTNAEQIAQLQQEIIHLKRTVGILARRAYPQLLPAQLPTEEVIIYTNGRAHVHDTDLQLLQNGDILVAFRDGSEHISADGKLVTVRSRDGGKTWGEYQVLRETPYTDEREINLTQLRNGTLLVSVYADDSYDGEDRYTLPLVNPGYRGRPHGIYVGRSTDNGQTWTFPETAMDPSPFKRVDVSEKIIELPNGRLLMPVYGNPQVGSRDTVSSVYASDDQGHHWRYLSTIATVPGHSPCEPAMVLTRTGRLIVMNRTQKSGGHIQCNSDDSGQTWSTPVHTNVPGLNHPCVMQELPSGDILCIYGTRQDPAGLYAVASHDNGASWDMQHYRVIRDDFPNVDIGYPSAALLPDGRILVAYYFNMFGRFYIAGSFFRWE